MAKCSSKAKRPRGKSADSVETIEAKLKDTIVKLGPKVDALHDFLTGLSPDQQAEFSRMVRGGVEDVAAMKGRWREMGVLALALVSQTGAKRLA